MDEDFKELFKRLTALGAGRPVGSDGFPPGPWTPDLLAEAITQVDANTSGIDLRTVQLWFQDNDKGISTDNIRWLARIFGCDDPNATSDWQAELSAAYRQLVVKRRMRAKSPQPAQGLSMDGIDWVDTSASLEQAPKANAARPDRRFSLATWSEALFSSRSTLNLPALVWAGCVTLGFLSYIMGVHSVTYSPVEGLAKQVGSFWAPNWTLLEMVILPAFLITVVRLLALWKEERRLLMATGGTNTEKDEGWRSRVESFSVSHWAVLFVCLFIVFLLQWSGIHLRALLSGDAGDLMMDWNLIAIVRPDLISIPEAVTLSMLAFLYTSMICFLFLTGLVFLYTMAQDFNETCSQVGLQSSDAQKSGIVELATRLMCGMFRACVLGVWIATCIKLQATYLLSDSKNIVDWLFHDALFFLGIKEGAHGWLDQNALAHFTSFLLLFSTCSVFVFCFIQVSQVLKLASPSNSAHVSSKAWGVQSLVMLGVVFLLVVNFLLIGQFSGFSILLLLAVCCSICSLIGMQSGQASSGRSNYR